MIWIFKGQLVIVCIVGHVGIIVHYQKFPHRNIANQFFVFREMFEQNRKSHQFMKLCIGVDVKCNEQYGEELLHDSPQRYGKCLE